MVRATSSSLKAQRSSMEPPPRPVISRSATLCRLAQAMAAQSSPGASAPVPAPAAPAPPPAASEPQYAEHIPHRRPRWGGNEGDFSGIARDGLLVGRVEQPLLVELLLKLFKGHMEIPHAVGGSAHYSRADTARPVERPLPGQRPPPSCRFPDGSAGPWPPAGT